MESCWPPTATSRVRMPKSLPSKASVASTSRPRSTQDLGHLRLLQPDDGDRAGLDDAALLGGDVLHRAAEEPLVVDRDRGHDGDLPVDDVGRVPRAAHADLDDGHVDGRVRERRVGHGDDHLEVGHPGAALGDRAGVDHLDERQHVVVGRDELLGRDRLAVQRDALADVVQVRGGEPPGGQAHLAQQPLDHPRGRRLAVGAGDVDDREGALGVAQQLHHRGDPVQRRLEVVLGGAGEDRLLHLPHPLAQVELLGGLLLGRVGTTGHHCTPSVSAGAVAGAVSDVAGTSGCCCRSGRVIHTWSGTPPPPASWWVSTKPLER